MKKIKIVAVLVALLGIFSSASRAFAANPYNITYSGGSALSASNVQINPNIVDNLSSLIVRNNITGLVFSNSSDWHDYYFLSNSDNCVRRKYILLRSNESVTPSDNLYYTISSDKYDLRVNINRVTLEGYDAVMSSSQSLGISVAYTDGGIGVNGDILYSDSACKNQINNIYFARANDNANAFIETNLKLYRKGESSVLVSDELYLGITDIDASQSFKILNSDNLLSQSNMYAKSAVALQPTTTTDRNMFVSSGNYIYSQGSFNISSGSDIFVKLGEGAQINGASLVLGFGTEAGSALQYYARQYRVDYETDGHGNITGITNETVMAGEKPTGSAERPHEYYDFDHWIVDKDVTLEDSTDIAAGSVIDADQIPQVIVRDDLVFTAINDPFDFIVTYLSDDNGEISGIDEEIAEAYDNPSGSETTPNDGFVLDHWVADKDVILEDDTEIPAGSPITPEQLTQVVILDDLEFTAIHIEEPVPDSESEEPAKEENVSVPNTGGLTSENIGLIISTTTPTAIILSILGAYFFSRKKRV